MTEVRQRSLFGQAILWYLASFAAHLAYSQLASRHFPGIAGLVALLILTAVDALFVVPAFLLTVLFINRRGDLPRLAVPILVILIALAFEAVFNAAFPSVMDGLTKFVLRSTMY